MENKEEVLLSNSIKCDNPTCNYEIYLKIENFKDYINKECPKCSYNLLTEDGFDDHSELISQFRELGEFKEVEYSEIKDNTNIIHFGLKDGIFFTDNKELNDKFNKNK